MRKSALRGFLPLRSARLSDASANRVDPRGPFPGVIVVEAETGGGFYAWHGFGDDGARGPFESRTFALAVAAGRAP